MVPSNVQFQTWLMEKSQLKFHTKNAYLRCLRYFINMMDKERIETFSHITFDMLYSFIHFNYKTKKPYKLGTVRIRAAAMHLFFSWLCENRFCSSNPMLAYKKNRIRNKKFNEVKNEKETFNNKDILQVDAQQLLKIEHKDLFLRSRDRAIICLLLDSGIYSNEMTALTFNNFDLKKGVVQIDGTKKRQVYFDSSQYREIYQQWLSTRNKKMLAGRDTPWLFFTKKFQPLNQQTLHHLVSNYFKKNINWPSTSPALLRKTAILNRLKKGDSIESIQKQMFISLLRLQQYQSLMN